MDFDSVEETARRVGAGSASAVEVVQRALERVGRLNPRLNALLSVSPKALDAAHAIDRKVKAGAPAGPLAGVPLAVKDLILTRELPTTAGSRVFGAGLETGKDAALVRRLRRAGAVVLAKAHLHEFAYGVTNENAHFGPCRNPHDPARISGGSSGGSAAAVAAGMCPASIGTDTRGSIRIPSAFCGLVGLKPTRGRVSLEGVLPLSRTLDHAGPLARSVADAALLFEVLRTPRRRGGWAVGADPSRHRLGVCEYYWSGLDREVERPLRAAVSALEEAGFEVREVALEGIEQALEASRVLAASEAFAYHRRFLEEQPQGYDPAVAERLRQGEEVRGYEVAEARQLRKVLIESFRRAFRQVDCLVGATVPCLPPLVGQGSLSINGREVAVVENLVRLNAPQNVAGVPALVLPWGSARGGLPVSLQLVAGVDREDVLFAVASRLEALRPGS